MASVRVEVKGLRELGERMRTLQKDMALKIARGATGAAASLVKKEARANIQRHPSVQTGALLNNVIAKRIPPAQTHLTSEHIVTVRGRGRGKRKGQGAPHAHFVEFGTETEFGTVRMPAEPFLRPALEHNVNRALEVMKRRIASGLTRAGR